MKYFNSVTGQYEDDGQEVIQPQMINIPAGRTIASQGSQDVNIPVYADLLKQRQQNTMDLNMDMQANPEAYPFSKMIDLSKPYEDIPLPLKQQQATQRAPAEMNPMVKAYLLNKMKPVNPEVVSKDTIPQDSQMLDIPQEKSNVLDQFSPEKYQQALAQMKEKQSNLGMAQFAAGMGDALARKDSSATDKYFQDARNNIQDQTVGEFNRQKAGAINDVKTKQQLSQLDPNSQESQNFRKLVQSTMPNIAKAYGDKFNMLTAADKDSILDFGKMRELIDARKSETQMKYDVLRQNQIEKNDSKAAKAQELSSTRAKQMGVYKNGIAAEQQFLNATKDKSNYDPTGSGQFIDNSDWAPNVLKNNKAIESQAARDAWVESFLRDASGAAISDKERAAYNKLYFPQPGDTGDVVSNKKALRDEKMRSAAASAGLSHDGVNVPNAPSQKQSSNQTDSKIDSFMKKNNISDRNEAIRILKEHGKI